MIKFLRCYVISSYVINSILLGPWLFSYNEAIVIYALGISISPISMSFFLKQYLEIS